MLVAERIKGWRRIRHIPIVDDQHKQVGILIHRDILRACIFYLASRVSDSRRVAAAERRQHLMLVPVREFKGQAPFTAHQDMTLG